MLQSPSSQLLGERTLKSMRGMASSTFQSLYISFTMRWPLCRLNLVHRSRQSLARSRSLGSFSPDYQVNRPSQLMAAWHGSHFFRKRERQQSLPRVKEYGTRDYTSSGRLIFYRLKLSSRSLRVRMRLNQKQWSGTPSSLQRKEAAKTQSPRMRWLILIFLAPAAGSSDRHFSFVSSITENMFLLGISRALLCRRAFYLRHSTVPSTLISPQNYMNIALQQLKCPICLELAEDAVQSSCCSQLFCQSCAGISSRSKDSCPLCKEPCVFEAAHFVRARIAHMEVGCKMEGCTVRVLLKDRKEHELSCEHRTIKCPYCPASLTLLRLPAHLRQSHKQKVYQFLIRLPQVKWALGSLSNYDPAKAEKNQYGRTARLGLSGKYYCGGRLDFPNDFCSKFCGPERGENCKACIKLDVLARGLQFGKYLVNEGGRSARVEDGSVFCGTWMFSYDGGDHCNQRHKCSDCEKLTKSLRRYIYLQNRQYDQQHEVDLNSEQ